MNNLKNQIKHYTLYKTYLQTSPFYCDIFHVYKYIFNPIRNAEFGSILCYGYIAEIRDHINVLCDCAGLIGGRPIFLIYPPIRFYYVLFATVALVGARCDNFLMMQENESILSQYSCINC